MVNGPTPEKHGDRLDEEIRRRLLDRDPEGLSMLLRAYGQLVRIRLASDLNGISVDEIDDAVQRGLEKVWAYAHKFDPQKAPLRGWFTVICRRVAVDVLAERARSGGDQIDEWSTVPDARSREVHPAVAVLREVIETLAPLQRAVVEADLAEPSGTAPADRLADEVGTTAGAVYNARKKARKAILKRLRSRGIDDESLFRGPTGRNSDESGSETVEDRAT